MTQSKSEDATCVSKQRLMEMLVFEPSTGVFRWLISTNGRIKVGQVAGCKHRTTGYILINIDGRQYKAHRLAWFYMTGQWPAAVIDHRDTDPSNNRWANLREATNSENGQNQRKAQRRSITGLLGVYRNRNKWAASIMTNGNRRFLGVFGTPDIAHDAYVKAKRLMHTHGTI